jgi:anti-sigma factor ChrR (cupin superfamily)
MTPRAEGAGPGVEWVQGQDVAAAQRAPGFLIRDLWRADSGAKAQLVEIAPGARYPGLDVHEPGPEEVFVVSGVFHDGTRSYPAGTFIHNPAGSSHVPQSEEGCTLFLFYPEG